jgi:hypothetical protein
VTLFFWSGRVGVVFLCTSTGKPDLRSRLHTESVMGHESYAHLNASWA